MTDNQTKDDNGCRCQRLTRPESRLACADWHTLAGDQPPHRAEVLALVWLPDALGRDLPAGEHADQR